MKKRQGTTKIDVRSPRVTPDELLRLSRIGTELRITDQILSLDLDAVSVVEDGPAPAWTTLDGDHISFSLRHMPLPNSRMNIAVWLGTNAHELGHVLFSPRSDSELMRRVIAAERTFMSGVAQLHNIVEDQRQERLLLARFAPWRGYLTAALAHHIVLDAESAWLLVAGRTWLSSDARSQARAQFVALHDENVTTRVTELIGSYQRLVDPGDAESVEAWEILEELHALFAENMPKMPQACSVMDGGEPDTDPGDEQAGPPAADETPTPSASTDGSDADDSDIADGADSADADGGADGASADAESQGNGDTDGSAAQGDAAESGQPSSSDADADAGGTGSSNAPENFSQGSFRGQLRDDAEAQLADTETKQDLDTVSDVLDNGRPGEEIAADDALGRFEDVTDSARRLHHEVSDALLDLKDESEPNWQRRVDSGRTNAARFARLVHSPGSVDPSELFDRYAPGIADATNIELVLLLDTSGSMQRHTQRLAESAYAIRSAVDDIEGRCTVATFSAGAHRIYSHADERPDSRMLIPNAHGGTKPSSALAEAFRVLADSAAPIRLMMILTDGEWSDSPESERLIAAMNDSGVDTVLAFLPMKDATSDEPSKLDAHKCSNAENISDVHGLARLFRDVAQQRIASQW